MRHVHKHVAGIWHADMTDACGECIPLVAFGNRAAAPQWLGYCHGRLQRIGHVLISLEGAFDVLLCIWAHLLPCCTFLRVFCFVAPTWAHLLQTVAGPQMVQPRLYGNIWQLQGLAAF